MQLAVDLVTLAILLFFVQEGFRRAGKWVAWGVFLALPVVLTLHWVQTIQVGVFPWAKLYTSLFTACWLTGLRFTPLAGRQWARDASLLILAVNILEAVSLDIFGGHSAHTLNVVTGLLLIVTLPHPPGAIWIDIGGRHRDLHCEGMTRAWIVGYTLWNWTFVYLNFPTIAGQQLAVLASAFAVGVIDPRRWLQPRTYTLAAYLLVLMTFPGFMVRRMDTSDWSTMYREDLASGTCLVIVAGYTVWFFFGRGDGSSEEVAPNR